MQPWLELVVFAVWGEDGVKLAQRAEREFEKRQSKEADKATVVETTGESSDERQQKD